MRHECTNHIFYSSKICEFLALTVFNDRLERNE